MTFNKMVRTLFIVIPSFFSMISNLATLLKFEARLAGRSLFILVLTLIGVFVLLITTWICVLSMFFVYFISLHLSFLVSLAIILLINLFVLGILGIIIFRAKKNLSFPETRYQLSRIAELKN